MNKFKVGDLVRGTESSPYNITTEDMTLGEVIEVYRREEGYGGDIRVKVLEHRRSRGIGSIFSVKSQYFDLIKSAPTENAPKIVLSPDNAEDIDWLTYKASRIVKRLSEKSGMPIDRLTSLILIGAERFVEIEDGKGKDKGKEE